jgi:AcrR family transcriptional regulator
MAKSKIKQSPKLPAETRREQLLEAAGSLFMQKGYRVTTTEEIARKAGLTKGALYFHFKNKEDILFDLVKHMHGELARVVEEIPAGTATPDQMLDALLKANSRILEANFVGYLDFWIQASRIPRIHKYMLDGVEDYTRLFAGRMDSCYGRTKKQRRDMAIFIMALFDGLTVRYMLGCSRDDLKRQIQLTNTLSRYFTEQSSKSKTR